jgi:hypothetical protein
LGPRAGYLTAMNKNINIGVIAGYMYKMVSTDDKSRNYWTSGFGLQVLYKGLKFEYFQIENPQFSIGIVYAFTK